MASGVTTLDEVVVPEVFTPYVQQQTEEKSRLVQSGVLTRDSLLDSFLAGGGLTINVPSWRDLDNEAENISTDNSGSSSSPKKTDSDQEIAVRISRNQSWSSMDLAGDLAGSDPMQSIGSRVAYYWTRRLQAAFVATINGVIKDNVANDSGDYQNDVSGGSFVDGVTNFSAEAFLDACTTMGDSEQDLVAVMVHSVVYNRMKKNNLIDFIPDSNGVVNIPTFLGKFVIVDDGMPRSGQIYDTWIFGREAVKLGVGAPKVPTETLRVPAAGDGGGQDLLFNRVEWCIHPTGHAYVGTAPAGGPGNGTSTNDLNVAGSWNRVYPERKQIKFARLLTREA